VSLIGIAIVAVAITAIVLAVRDALPEGGGVRGFPLTWWIPQSRWTS
jgi:hypothetical protein